MRKKKKVQYCHFPGYGFKWEKRKVDGRWQRVSVADEEERRVMRSIVTWRMNEGLTWDEITAHLKDSEPHHQRREIVDHRAYSAGMQGRTETST